VIFVLYVVPVKPEIELDTVNRTPYQNALEIIAFLEERGFLLSVRVPVEAGV
jgi:hypothetical protein